MTTHSRTTTFISFFNLGGIFWKILCSVTVTRKSGDRFARMTETPPHQKWKTIRFSKEAPGYGHFTV
jgi:hypothetical protein